MVNSKNLIKKTRDNSNQDDGDGIMREVVLTRRTTKVVKGGKKTTFSAMVVVGDKKGHVGVAIGKALDVRNAVEKAVKKAKKAMITVPLDKTTIPHEVDVKSGASKIMLRPARKGTGMRSSNVVRIVLELVGIQDIVAKMHGTSNRITNTYAIMKAMKMLKPTRVSKKSNETSEASAPVVNVTAPVVDQKTGHNS